MKSAAISLVLGALLLTPARGHAAARDLSGEFVVAEGMEVTIWAESPLFFKPTNIDVDARGRIWVAEGVNYRSFRGKDVNQPDAVALRHPEGDRIMILEDTDGDGAADSSKVFVQDKDLVAPLGVAVIGNRVFVSCSPHLIAYTIDASGDKPAKKEIFLTGFGGHDHDHGLHSVIAGPDGRLYFNAGNAGPHLVRDRGGKTLRAGSIYTGGSPYNPTNTPNMRSDDGRVWTGGLALRIDPDGRNLAVLSHNFRNSYEVAVDSHGDLWQNDNDDEVRACRTSWMMEGGNMGFFSADGTRTWRADQRPGQTTQAAQWHQDDPGVMPAGDIYGAGGPTGVGVYEGDLLPSLRGAVLDCDAGRNTVFAHRPVPDGAGFRLERSAFLTSQRGSTEGYRWDKVSMEDKTTWFRPSDVTAGTDGAIYVADWFDPVVGGHAMRGPNGYGRILRIAPKGSRPRAPKLDLSSRAGLLAAMQSPAINVRFAARERLLTGSADATAVLDELARSTNPVFRARAAWFPGRWETALNDIDERVRVTAWRAARMTTPEKAWDFARQMLDEARFRGGGAMLWREFALALRDVPFDHANSLLLALAERFDGKDRFHLEALGLGCDGKEQALYPVLLAKLGHADPLQWSDAFAALVWRLHPASCVPAVAQRAGAPALPSVARRQAVDTLAFIRDRAAAEAMLALATGSGSSDDVRTNALWWARFRAGNDWKSFDLAARLPASQKSAAERAAQAKVQAWRTTLLDARAPAAQRETAATALAATEPGGLALLQLAGSGQFPKQFTEAVTETIFRNPSPAVRAMASQYFQRPSRGGGTFPPVAELLQRRGNPARGAKVFASASAACATCHLFGGKGGGIGPDLTTVRTKLGREGTLDAILNPSAVIAAGYEPWLIETREGETWSGFIVSDGDTVMLKDLSGATRSIPAQAIASRRQQKLSLMPDNLALGLTPDELVDLLEHLLTDPAPRP